VFSGLDTQIKHFPSHKTLYVVDLHAWSTIHHYRLSLKNDYEFLGIKNESYFMSNSFPYTSYQSKLKNISSNELSFDVEPTDNGKKCCSKVIKNQNRAFRICSYNQFSLFTFFISKRGLFLTYLAHFLMHIFIGIFTSLLISLSFYVCPCFF
jgi:hypothetical protein